MAREFWLFLYFTYFMKIASAIFIQSGDHSLELKNNSELVLQVGRQKLTLKPLHLTELASDGRSIQDASGAERKIDLTSKLFDISNVTVDKTDFPTYKVFRMSCGIHTSSNSSAVMTWIVKIFLQPGKIKNLPFGESPAYIGTTEIKINLENFTFCQNGYNSCFVENQSIDGAYLDLVIGMSDVQGDINNIDRAFTFDNGKLAYSTFVDVNSGLKEMFSGYPQLIKQNDQYAVVLRFKKAQTSVSSFKYSHLIADVFEAKPSSTSIHNSPLPVTSVVSKHSSRAETRNGVLLDASAAQPSTTACNSGYQTVYLVTRSVVKRDHLAVASHAQESKVTSCTYISSTKQSRSPLVYPIPSETPSIFAHSTSLGQAVSQPTPSWNPSQQRLNTNFASGRQSFSDNVHARKSTDFDILESVARSKEAVPIVPTDTAEPSLGSADGIGLSNKAFVLSTRADNAFQSPVKTTPVYLRYADDDKDIGSTALQGKLLQPPVLPTTSKLSVFSQYSLSKTKLFYYSTATKVNCHVTTIISQCSVVQTQEPANFKASVSTSDYSSQYSSVASQSSNQYGNGTTGIASTASQTDFTPGRYFPPLSSTVSNISPIQTKCKGISKAIPRFSFAPFNMIMLTALARLFSNII